MEKIGEHVNIRKIAVTGTLSAGKSTVCDLLKAHNAYVLKADDIVHELLSQDAITIQQVKEEFGESVIQNGKVDRKTLATRVFTRPDQLNKLEQILHPKVVQTIKNAYTSTDKLFVVER